jgi:hypothetical protein
VQTRLNDISNVLVKQLQQMSTASLVKVGLEACEQAAKQSKLDLALAQNAMKTLRDGQLISVELRKRLSDLATQLDNEYLSMEDAGDEGPVSTEESTRLFNQARAATAISLLAGEEISTLDVAEAIYEAQAACDDQIQFWNPIERTVQEILKVF